MYKYVHTQSHTHSRSGRKHIPQLSMLTIRKKNGRDPFSFSINNYFKRIFYNVHALKYYFSISQNFKISISEDYHKVSTTTKKFVSEVCNTGTVTQT